MRLNALFRLAFASATPLGLTSPHTVTRRLILQKARHRGCTLRYNDSLTACKPTVSGTISLPSRGSFHLSLAVLVHYRSPINTEAYGVVPTDSCRLLGPAITWDTSRSVRAFRVRDCYPLWSTFPDGSTTQHVVNSVVRLKPYVDVPRHRADNPFKVSRRRGLA